MAPPALRHRIGEVVETASATERRTSAGRTKRFARCQVRWDDGVTDFIDLSEVYQPGERTAVIFSGDSQICDVNLRTGRQSVIGDRLEGIPAFLLAISVPLMLLLVGIPLYFGVRAYSKVTTRGLRKRVSQHVEQLLLQLHAPGARSPAPVVAG
jgi:hypothetical protein